MQSKVILAFHVDAHCCGASRVQAGVDEFEHHAVHSGKGVESRIVCLGWAVGEVIVERTVKPIGCEMEPPARMNHGVTNELAREEGFPLEEVLNEFMIAVTDVMLQGGYIIGHNVFLQGGIVENELQHLKMSALRHVWKRMMKHALCLRSPDIGRWLREILGQEAGASSASNALSLCELSHLLLPEAPAGRRNVGQVAAVCLQLLEAIVGLMRPCEHADHVFVKIFPPGPRDNGECIERCLICNQTR